MVTSVVGPFRGIAHVKITALEVVGCYPDNPVLSLTAEGNFTAEQARIYARQLLAAADQLDKLNETAAPSEGVTPAR